MTPAVAAPVKYYEDEAARVWHGDCRAVMAALEPESVDACVTDPPYGIGFMGREWDTFKPGSVKQPERFEQAIESDNPNLRGRRRSPAISESQIAYDYSTAGLRAFQAWTESWGRELIRVLKPGAYGVVCGAPRAYHRMASGLEDAGFEVRDCLAWLFGSGFPKSLNLGDGLGTALKPAHEPIALIRKPFKGTVAANLERHGTGALNIDAARIDPGSFVGGGGNGRPSEGSSWQGSPRSIVESHDLGRWPANVVIDDLAALVIDEQSGELSSGGGLKSQRTCDWGEGGPFRSQSSEWAGDGGGASRFYYCAKPSRAERDAGCGHLPRISAAECVDREEDSAGLRSPRAGAGRTGGGRNFHPTVKPVDLMRWLIRLTTPAGGTVIDPFLGSGTTWMAARAEMRVFLGCDMEQDYLRIAVARAQSSNPLFFSAGISQAVGAIDPVGELAKLTTDHAREGL